MKASPAQDAWTSGHDAGVADARSAWLAVGTWTRPAVPVPAGGHAERKAWIDGYSAGIQAYNRRVQVAASGGPGCDVAGHDYGDDGICLDCGDAR